MAPVFNVAMLIYEDADLLDVAGPLEILTTAPPAGSTHAFKTTTFACQNPVKVFQAALTVVPDASLQEIEANLESYDILIVPGAQFEPLAQMIPSENGQAIIKLIKRFSALPPRKETGHRVLQSVCSGAWLLAAAGLFANRTVTTHHLCYDTLKKIANETAGGDSKINVVRKRWVEAGSTEAGVRILTAGGVSSGLCATLHLVETLAGKELADWTADIVEYERKHQDDGWGA